MMGPRCVVVLCRALSGRVTLPSPERMREHEAARVQAMLDAGVPMRCAAVLRNRPPLLLPPAGGAAQHRTERPLAPLPPCCRSYLHNQNVTQFGYNEEITRLAGSDAEPLPRWREDMYYASGACAGSLGGDTSVLLRLAGGRVLS